MPDIKLVYFDLRGRGEPSRLVLAAAGKEWEDVRIPFDEWPAQKDSSPYGQLPYLEYKGKTYGQSQAIAGFLAREFGLYGRSNIDGLRIMEVCNLVVDLIQYMSKANLETDEEKKAELGKKLAEEDVPRYLGYFERLLKDNGSRGFFIGNSMSLADLTVYDITDTVLLNSPDALAYYPLIAGMRTKVADHPNVKAYLANRRDAPY